jgi:8-oxo-dGTP diphosphatase
VTRTAPQPDAPPLRDLGVPERRDLDHVLVALLGVKVLAGIAENGTSEPGEKLSLLPAKVVKGWSMSDLGQARRSTLLDAAWRTAYRVGFPLARIWWRLRHQQHEGALVAVYVGQALLLVRSSYRIEWNFPGGTVRQGEKPEAAARRELAEEIGLAGAFPLVVVGDACGLWDGRKDKVHFFELRLDRLPELQLDNREIIGARLISLSELRGMALTGPVAVYLGRTIPPGCHSE